MKGNALGDDAQASDLAVDWAIDPEGCAIRTRLRKRLGPSIYHDLVTGFAVNLQKRFSRMEAAALEQDAVQIAGVADILGFMELRRAAMRLLFACRSGEGILDALARVSIAQTDAIVAIALESNTPGDSSEGGWDAPQQIARVA